MKKERGAEGFARGAVILTAAMAAVKVIGAVFKIPLKQTFGEYGMGLFNVAYSFYGPVFSLATVGFPVAVSRLVSESASTGKMRDAGLVKRVAMPLFLLVGGVGMVLMTVAAPFYCKGVIGNAYAIAPMLALAPAIMFACAGSVVRGYYEGLQDMKPTAVSQVIEAAVKLVLGLGLSRWAMAHCSAEYEKLGTVFKIVPKSDDDAVLLSLSFAAAGAVLGVTVGSAAALVYLLISDGRRKNYKKEKSIGGQDSRAVARRLLAITVPIAAGAIATNAAGLIDAAFLQGTLNRLAVEQKERLLACYPGMIPQMYLENEGSLATFLYGCYTLAATVYLLVPALSQPIGISALPSVTNAWARGGKAELERRIAAVVRMTAVVCLPAGVGICALAEPIVTVLYGGGATVEIVAGVLTVLGVASVFTALCAPLSAVLQAVGRAELPVWLLAAAMTLKLVINRVLCAVPEINLYGAAVGTLVGYLFLAAAQLLAVKKAAGVRLRVTGALVKPAVAAVLCGASARVCYGAVSRVVAVWTALGISILTGGIIYCVFLLLLGGIEKNDLNMLPKGQKIAKKLENQGWM